MNAAEILRTHWSDLLPGDVVDVEHRFRTLLKIWHPDHCKDPMASEVTSHLTDAKAKALGRKRADSVSFAKENGKFFHFEYLSRRPWDSGEIFVTQTAVVYRVRPDLADLAHEDAKHRWEFRDDKLRDGVIKFLPGLRMRVQTRDEGELVIFSRDPERVLLSDLLDRSGPVHPDHVTWIVSGLMSLCSYFYVSGYAHLGLTTDMLTINPQLHEVALTGPALFLSSGGARPRAVPADVLAANPWLRDPSPENLCTVDTRAVRKIAMRLLGVSDLAALRTRTDVPPLVRAWIASAPDKNTIRDYEHWVAAKGPRPFVRYDVTAQKVYRP